MSSTEEKEELSPEEALQRIRVFLPHEWSRVPASGVRVERIK